MTAVRVSNLALAFAVEVAAFVALAVVGWRLGGPLVGRVALAAGVTVATAVLWAFLLAPKATHPLTGAPHVALKVLVLGGAAALLAATGSPSAGAVLGALVAVHLVLAVALGQIP